MADPTVRDENGAVQNELSTGANHHEVSSAWQLPQGRHSHTRAARERGHHRCAFHRDDGRDGVGGEPFEIVPSHVTSTIMSGTPV